VCSRTTPDIDEDELADELIAAEPTPIDSGGRFLLARGRRAAAGKTPRKKPTTARSSVGAVEPAPGVPDEENQGAAHLLAPRVHRRNWWGTRAAASSAHVVSLAGIARTATEHQATALGPGGAAQVVGIAIRDLCPWHS
jgi:hypothetical protein